MVYAQSNTLAFIIWFLVKKKKSLLNEVVMPTMDEGSLFMRKVVVCKASSLHLLVSFDCANWLSLVSMRCRCLFDYPILLGCMMACESVKNSMV